VHDRSSSTTLFQELHVQAAKGTQFYKPELDALRFVAFLAVFAFHAVPRSEQSFVGFPPALSAICRGGLSSGACGVDLFFALSAYLITALLVRERESTGELEIRHFYVRRILRIWPLYFAFLGVASLLAVGVKSQSLGWPYIVGFSLLAGNWVYAALGIPHSIALPLWSVSIEEQFYLLWPLAVRRASRLMMVCIAVCLFVAASVMRGLLVLGHVGQTAMEYNTVARLDPIALGILLALWNPAACRMARGVSLAASVVIAIGVGVWCGLYPLDNTTVNGMGNLIGRPLMAVASVALLVAVQGVRGWFTHPVLLYLGKVSYGLYVFHLVGLKLAGPIANHVVTTDAFAGSVMRAGIGLLITIIFAAISYRYLESPFLRLKERFSHVRSRPV
jgi:peptidoglycan/LPS O-acetylase OafA/YrhL